MTNVKSISWENGKLLLLDQRRLPAEEVWIPLTKWTEVAAAIRDMVVRGAPAIGVAAAYGMVLAAAEGSHRGAAREGLAQSRPTAVNLFWALDQMDKAEWSVEDQLRAAEAVEQYEINTNRAIGANGAALVPEKARILTICNTGSLATPGIGTALGIIRTAHEQGKVQHVYACETRPRMQGLRLTAYELLSDGIQFSMITDSMAGTLMATKGVDLVVVGADRITANGDTANKVGTYTLAVLAKHHGVPFMVAAPRSTIDNQMGHGSEIPIEERDASELLVIDGVQVGPVGCPVWNPAFDVTPNGLIHAIVTESGAHRPPYAF